MRKRILGVSLIELLIVVAIIVTFAGIGSTFLNFAGAATRQAAQITAAAVNRARLEAIRTNGIAGLEVIAGADGGNGTLRVCNGVDPTTSPLVCPADTSTEDFTVQLVNLADGELSRAVILDSASIFFDRRGVMRSPTTTAIRIADRSGGNQRIVQIFATGRAVVQ